VELGHVIGKQCGLMACAGHSDVSEPRVEQVRMDAGVGIHQDAFCRQTLGAMAGDGIAVIEVTVFNRIEVELAVVVETG